MDSYEIYRHAGELVQRHGTNDPVRLCKDMGIKRIDVPDFTDLLGMYTYRWKHRIILMNPNINRTLYRMVLAHEIGHDQQHRHLAAGDGLQEFQLFNITDMTEYEANAYASHILIDDTEMLDLFKAGYDIAAVAKMLHVNVNLLLIKTQELNRMGMDFKLPYSPDARFFRNTRD